MVGDAEAVGSVPAGLNDQPDVEVLEIEQHGFDHIAESERYLRVRALFTFWVGSNAYLYYVFIGAILLSLGLSLVAAIAALVLGFSLYILVGLGSVGGARSGLPTMTLTRAAFGVRGNRLNALLAWFELLAFEALNAIFGVFAFVALAAEIGWADSGAAGYVVGTFVVIGISALVAIYGHRMLFVAQKAFAIGLTTVLVVVAAMTIGSVDWAHAGTLDGSAAIGPFLVGTAIVAAAPLSFLIVCADYPRYLPSNTPAGPIVGWTFAGAASISLFLGIVGAALATNADLGTDPIGGMKPLVPTWLFIVYALAAAGGSIANNAITFYSSGLTLQAVGIPLRRWRATLLDCIIATALVLYILLVNQDLQTTTANFLAVLNVWVGPFGAIWITDGILRRWRYDPASIHTISPASRYWGVSGFKISGLAALAVGMVVGALTINAPVFKGPLAALLLDGDLAWIAAPLAASATYWLLAGRVLRTEGTEPT
jgi:nucleobase:cation symporter-1, NCS1 family